MGTELSLARTLLETARETFVEQTSGLTINEALDAGAGYRSILGLVKHTAAWAGVYRSYAFDAEPRGWDETDWPRGLRDRIHPSQEYLTECLAWGERNLEAWIDAMREPLDLDTIKPVHWGETWPLGRIVAYVATHVTYHAGEINEILAIRRAEAWEYGEHVEENHISTVGHSVRRAWNTDEDVARIESAMRAASRKGGT